MNEDIPKFCCICAHLRLAEELTPLHGVKVTRRCALVLPPWMPAPDEASRVVGDYDSCSFWIAPDARDE